MLAGLSTGPCKEFGLGLVGACDGSRALLTGRPQEDAVQRDRAYGVAHCAAQRLAGRRRLRTLRQVRVSVRSGLGLGLSLALTLALTLTLRLRAPRLLLQRLGRAGPAVRQRLRGVLQPHRRAVALPIALTLALCVGCGQADSGPG